MQITLTLNCNINFSAEVSECSSELAIIFLKIESAIRQKVGRK
jgi:hypothetical protein